MPIQTPICDFGQKAKDFKLKSTDNKMISLNDINLFSVDFNSKFSAFFPKSHTGVLIGIM